MTDIDEKDPQKLYVEKVDPEVLAGIKADPPEITLLRIEAEAGDPAAQRDLALRIIELEMDDEFDEAAGWLRAAAEQGDAEAQYQIYYCRQGGYSRPTRDGYYVGMMFKFEKDEAYANLVKAAAQDHPMALYYLGTLYLPGSHHDSPFEEDPEEALKYLEKAADMGVREAYSAIIRGCRDGDFFFEDPMLEEIWRKKAIETDDPEILSDVAFYSLLDKDYEEAFRLNKRAADLGYDHSKLSIALDYIIGSGTEKNIAEGIRLYEELAEKGNPDALKNLGEIYIEGELVPQDIDKAVSYFKRAGEKDLDALSKLADYFYEGRYVKKDLAMAKSLLQEVSAKEYRVFEGWETETDELIKKIDEEMNGKKPAPAKPAGPAKPASPSAPAPAKPTSPSAPAAPAGRVKRRYINWDIVWMCVGAIAASWVFLRGTPIYNYSIEHARELPFMVKPLLQFAAIAISVIGAAAAAGLVLLTINEGLGFFGGIAAGVAGLISIFCYENPAAYEIATKAALIVTGLAVFRIALALLAGLRKR